MNRKEAKGLIDEVPAIIRNGDMFLLAEEVNSCFEKIYDDFEQDLAIATSDVNCDGCINSPANKGGNYPLDCGECSRFYADKFEEKKDA